jgi:hypothetical protein
VRLPTLFPLAALLLAGTAQAELHPPGALIEEAAVVDVTDNGLDAVGDLIPALIPTSFDIPDMSDDGSIYEYSLSGAWASLSVTDAAIVPQNGMLTLDADFMVWINDSSDKFDLYFEILWVISDTCHGYVEPFPAWVSIDLMLDVVPAGDGTYVLDATLGAMDVTYDLQSSDIQLEDCSIGYLEDVLNFFGLSLYDLILDFADGAIQDAIGDATADIETMIEDAFASATIQEQLDVNGATVDLMLSPRDVEIVPEGLRIIMQGSFDGNPPAECIAAYDPGGSPMTTSDPPGIGEFPSSISPSTHMGLLASDDMLNQLMYAVWRGGVLCYTIDEDFESFPMSTSVLGILDGPDAEGPFDVLFPENQDMAIITRPVNQPMANLEGSHDVDLAIEDLGLDFITAVDHRQARVLALDLQANIGADLALDGTTGELAINLDLGEGAIVPEVGSCEIAADAADLVVENFGGLLDTIIEMVAGDALSGLTFNLPAFEGLGLTSLDTAPAGASADWLGIFASLGPVTYEGGCDEEGGCDSGDGCSGGCSGVPSRTPWFFLALGAGLLARRRRGSERKAQ